MHSSFAVKQATQILLFFFTCDPRYKHSSGWKSNFSKFFRHRPLIESNSAWPASVTFSHRPQIVSSKDQKNPSVWAKWTQHRGRTHTHKQTFPFRHTSSGTLSKTGWLAKNKKQTKHKGMHQHQLIHLLQIPADKAEITLPPSQN